MVNIVFINIVKQIRILTYNCKNNASKTNIKNNKKVNWNSVFYSVLRRTKNFKFQKIRLYKLCRIKTIKESYKIIKRKNYKITYPDHKVSDRRCISPENIRKGIKKKQNSCNNLQHNQCPAAVCF